MFFRKDSAKHGHKLTHENSKDHLGNDDDDAYYLDEKFPQDFRNVMKIVEDTKKTVEDTKKIVDDLNTSIINELRTEIAELKQERKETNKYMWEILTKFVDKPAAPTASQLYAASKTASSTPNSSSATAGPKGKLP